MNLQPSTCNSQHLTAGYLNLPIQDEASGMDEIERKRLAAAIREWRGFWTGLMIAVGFSLAVFFALFVLFCG